MCVKILNQKNKTQTLPLIYVQTQIHMKLDLKRWAVMSLLRALYHCTADVCFLHWSLSSSHR
jgi:hypothetical protein